MDSTVDKTLIASKQSSPISDSEITAIVFESVLARTTIVLHLIMRFPEAIIRRIVLGTIVSLNFIRPTICFTHIFIEITKNIHRVETSGTQVDIGSIMVMITNDFWIVTPIIDHLVISIGGLGG